jgi:murein tripeptide amidase MpaA
MAQAVVSTSELGPGGAGPELAFDRFYRFDELTDYLRAWAAARPDLVQVESIGASWEGRDIWLVTVTNAGTGPPAEKPALLVEGNIHAVEWTGGVAALNVIQRLARDYGTDDRVTRLLDTRCVFVVPRLNPDGVEAALGAGRYIRSSVRPYPAREQGPGLREGDVDGDGRFLFMRIRDPNGPFKLHPDEPRLLVPREPDEYGGDYYRLLPEGEIEGYDGVTLEVAEPPEGLDLGANFPGDRSQDPEAVSPGPFPGSEPEIAAYLQAVRARPNITAYITCHTFGAITLRPPHNDESDVPLADERTFRVLGDKAAELTGYRTMSYLDLKYDRRMVVRGSQSQWFYDHLGVHSWITEFWSPMRAAGVELGTEPASLWLGGDHPVEDDLKLIRWSDEHTGGRAFVDWYAFDHPQLGPVELGGWDKIDYWYNAPFEVLEHEIAPHTEWVIYHALASPRLELRPLQVEQVDARTYRVRAVVQNTGWLPTYVTQRALDRRLVDPVLLELEGAEPREVGQLEGRTAQRASTTWWSYEPASKDLAVAEWIVPGEPGQTVTVTARHARAGTARATATLS